MKSSAVAAAIRPIIDADSFWLKALISATGAYLTAVSAQIAIPLPFTPIPLTGQVFAVLLLAGILRPTLAGASQGIYLLAGTCGLPWYAAGGCGYQFGPNGGYLIGFLIAAPLISALLQRKWFRASITRVALAMTAGLAAIYLAGAMQYALVLRSSLTQTFAQAIAPFVIVDAMKILLAATIVRRARVSHITARHHD